MVPCESLLTRMHGLQDLLYTQAVLGSPLHMSPDVLLPPLQRLRTTIPVVAKALPVSAAFASSATHRLAPASDVSLFKDTDSHSSASQPENDLPSAPPHLLAIFSPAAAASLASNTPPRAVDPFPLADSWARLDNMVKDLEGAVKLWANWIGPMRDGRGGGWIEAKEYAVASGRRALCPFVKSVHQVSTSGFACSCPSPLTPRVLKTIILSSSTVFGVGSVLTLVSSFLEATTGLPESVWGMLRLISEREDRLNAPARTTLGWADRVGRLLVEDLAHGFQNRARQRRNIVKRRDRLSAVTEGVSPSFCVSTNYHL